MSAPIGEEAEVRQLVTSIVHESNAHIEVDTGFSSSLPEDMKLTRLSEEIPALSSLSTQPEDFIELSESFSSPSVTVDYFAPGTEPTKEMLNDRDKEPLRAHFDPNLLSRELVERGVTPDWEKFFLPSTHAFTSVHGTLMYTFKIVQYIRGQNSRDAFVRRKQSCCHLCDYIGRDAFAVVQHAVASHIHTLHYLITGVEVPKLAFRQGQEPVGKPASRNRRRTSGKKPKNPGLVREQELSRRVLCALLQQHSITPFVAEGHALIRHCFNELCYRWLPRSTVRNWLAGDTMYLPSKYTSCHPLSAIPGVPGPLFPSVPGHRSSHGTLPSLNGPEPAAHGADTVTSMNRSSIPGSGSGTSPEVAQSLLGSKGAIEGRNSRRYPQRGGSKSDTTVSAIPNPRSSLAELASQPIPKPRTSRRATRMAQNGSMGVGGEEPGAAADHNQHAPTVETRPKHVHEFFSSYHPRHAGSSHMQQARVPLTQGQVDAIKAHEMQRELQMGGFVGGAGPVGEPPHVRSGHAFSTTMTTAVAPVAAWSPEQLRYLCNPVAQKSFGTLPPNQLPLHVLMSPAAGGRQDMMIPGIRGSAAILPSAPHFGPSPVLTPVGSASPVSSMNMNMQRGPGSSFNGMPAFRVGSGIAVTGSAVGGMDTRTPARSPSLFLDSRPDRPVSNGGVSLMAPPANMAPLDLPDPLSPKTLAIGAEPTGTETLVLPESRRGSSDATENGAPPIAKRHPMDSTVNSMVPLFNIYGVVGNG